MANDFVFAKIISKSKNASYKKKLAEIDIYWFFIKWFRFNKNYFSYQTSDFVFAKVISKSKHALSAYNFEIDIFSFIDTLLPSYESNFIIFFSSYRSYKSNQFSSPRYLSNQTLIELFHTSKKSKKFSSIFLFLNCLERIKISLNFSDYSTFDQIRRIFRMYHNAHLRQLSNDYTNDLINFFDRFDSLTCLFSQPSRSFQFFFKWNKL